MISAPGFVRCIICLAVMAAAAALAPWSAAGGGAGLSQDCGRWPQNQLIVGDSLQSRRFLLEPKGQVQLMPPYLEAGARRIYHRTFSLSLDVAEPIALYHTHSPKTCAIGRDTEKALAFRIPVFFVGSAGQSAEDLKADAERTAFAPSARLAPGADFAEVDFRLRKGGSSFTDIRPFFACGLAGLILCEGYCPGDTPAHARSLVEWIIKGVEWRAPALPAEDAPAAPQASAKLREPEARAPEAAPLPPRAGVAPTPAAPETAPAPSTTEAQPLPGPEKTQPPAAAETPRAPQEAPPKPQPPVAANTPPSIPAEPPPARKAGPILIALVSSDSEFSSQLGAGAVEGFWSGALDLAAAVSEGSWQRKLLARAQSPGFSPETGILDDSSGGRLAAGPKRDSILRKLIQGSHLEPGSPITGFKPLERFQLDLALEPLKRDAGILPGTAAAKEALLLITGGIDPGGSYFCRRPLRPDTSQLAIPQWAKQAQRIFVLEVWSDTSAQALQRIFRAKAAEGAPPGIYLCNIPGAGGANIALYGIVPEVLSESARAGAFEFLTAQAKNYLRP